MYKLFDCYCIVNVTIKSTICLIQQSFTITFLFENMNYRIEYTDIKLKTNYLLPRFLEQTDMACQEMIRLGSPGDGGWDMCVLKHFKVQRNECLIYSFG